MQMNRIFADLVEMLIRPAPEDVWCEWLRYVFQWLEGCRVMDPYQKATTWDYLRCMPPIPFLMPPCMTAATSNPGNGHWIWMTTEFLDVRNQQVGRRAVRFVDNASINIG
jgi:hypothetical protein